MIHPEVDWIAKWAHYTPGRLFLRDQATGREWTYAEAHRRAGAVAAWLRDDHGIGRGDRVAVLARNCCEHVFLFLGCVKLGAVLVPLNFRLTAPELAVPLADAEPALVLRTAEFADRIGAISCPAVDLDGLTALVRGAEAGATFAADRPGDLDDLVMILYTSGTTGVPKGAMITHRMLLWNAINTELRLDLTSADHSLAFAPFFHTGGWNVLLTPFLHCGASHTLLENFDAALILGLIERERVTLLFGVPTMLQMLADEPRFGATDLASLRYAIVGGAPMPVPLIDVWHARRVFIRQGYGLTEVGPNCFSLHQDHAVDHAGSIGFPNFYIETRVVAEDGRDCADDEVGELWLRSEVVTPGYWRKPAATAEAITDGWFHTGDLVRRAAGGFFHVVDRKKNMYISGGENVYPAEVEAVLVAHPAVREAAVVGIPDPRWGEAGRAFLVLNTDQALDEADLRAHCLQRLAKFKIPREFVTIEALPRNDAGKVDRTALGPFANPEER
ncbi:MAG TPA: long-chain fatty acid--CoA ligase [Candidatus Krumholzibacteria bacterium]|nr:long-chain fatty acid--CoA ligase [Candidatus Krumholzibacteria bacterium]